MSRPGASAPERFLDPRSLGDPARSVGRPEDPTARRVVTGIDERRIDVAPVDADRGRAREVMRLSYRGVGRVDVADRRALGNFAK